MPWLIPDTYSMRAALIAASGTSDGAYIAAAEFVR